PGEGRTGQAQVGAEVGQGNVDHGEIQDQHELRHADHRERLPAARVRGVLRLAQLARVTSQMRGVHYGLLTSLRMWGPVLAGGGRERGPGWSRGCRPHGGPGREGPAPVW